MTIEQGYRLIELGSAQLTAGNPSVARETFRRSQETFVQVGRSPLLALHRRLAADIAALPAERVLETRNGPFVSGLHVSDDGKLIAVLFDYESRNNANDSTIEQLRTEPAVQLWNSGGKLIVEHPPLSPIGMLVYPDFNSQEVRELPELHEREGALVRVLGVKQPHHLVVELTVPADGGSTDSRLEALSLRDGSRSAYLSDSPTFDAVDVGFEDRTLRLELRDENRSVFHSQFFDISPDDGIDREYEYYVPEIAEAESADQSRVVVASYEGAVAMFDTSDWQ